MCSESLQAKQLPSKGLECKWSGMKICVPFSLGGAEGGMKGGRNVSHLLTKSLGVESTGTLGVEAQISEAVSIF